MARSRPTDPPAPRGTGKGATGPGSRFRRRGGSSGATASGRGAKVGKDGQPKGGRLKKVGNQVRMIKQAYSLTRKNDPRLPWFMLIAFVAVVAVVELIGILLDSPFLFLPVAILLGLLAAMIVFGRRAQGSAYRQVEGQPGAAAWVLEGMRGDWQVSSGVAGTTQLDAVHRVLGRPGVILVGEGSPSRVRPLLAQEKKRVARIAGDTPIYDLLVGDEEGQIPLRKLSAHVMKLPRNLSGGELNALRKRLAAMGGSRMPVPGGPLPGGRQMSVSQRQVRRR
jgi:F0F1-type ATP synthase assembly protein I